MKLIIIISNSAQIIMFILGNGYVRKQLREWLILKLATVQFVMIFNPTMSTRRQTGRTWHVCVSPLNSNVVRISADIVRFLFNRVICMLHEVFVYMFLIEFSYIFSNTNIL